MSESQKYYTSKYNGEEIDKRLDSVSVLGGAASPQGALANLGAGVRPNLLDNAIFIGGGTGWGVFPVNQRGVSGTIRTPGYFIDRWKLVSGTVKITSAGLALNGTIAQILPSSIGSVYTATALTTTGIVTCKYDGVSRTFTVTGTGQTFVFAKLEKGLGQTAAYQDTANSWIQLPQPESSYSTQLANCQAYYWESDGFSLNENDYIMTAGDNKFIKTNIRFPVQMNRIPTVTITSINGTPGILSNWQYRTDSDIQAVVNPSSLTKSGFENIMSPNWVNGIYSFMVIANAEL